MTQQWSLPAWVAVAVALGAALLLLLTVALLLAARGERRRHRDALDRAAAGHEELQERVRLVERRLAAEARPGPGRADDEHPGYVITEVGDPRRDLAAHRDAHPDGHQAVPGLPAPLFADAVLRESVVQAASLAAGVRHALSPRTRHRIGFEMRREVKHARRRCRQAQRAARRSWGGEPEQGSAA